MSFEYKVGDQVFLRAKITAIDDKGYPINVALRVLGDDDEGQCWFNSNVIAMKDSCSCAAYEDFNYQEVVCGRESEEPSEKEYELVEKVSVDESSGKCNCLHEEYGKQVCYGTKEREQCSCDGDQMKCNYYDEVRKRQKERIYILADHTDKGTIVTADLYRATLRDIYDMNYCDILKIFDIKEYSNVKNKDEAITNVIEKYTPEKVVDIYEKYQAQFFVYKYDVIENVFDKKQYLVTKICRCLIYLISNDGETKTETIGCLERNDYKKVKQNVSMKEFFNLD